MPHHFTAAFELTLEIVLIFVLFISSVSPLKTLPLNNQLSMILNNRDDNMIASAIFTSLLQ